VCILVAWRGDQIGADHRLRQLLADAHRAGTGTVLSLSRLSQSVVLEMAQAALGSLPEPLGQRLYRETEGLPFFVAEYLAMMASGAPAGDPSGWSLPGGVRDLLRSRLAAVDDTGRQLLGAAAVIGRSFDFDTLREASGRSDEETAAALEVLIARGLVEEMGGAGAPGVLTYDFTHEKLRALTYEETSLARRRLLHRRVAEALAARARSRPQPLGPLASQIAQHYTLAGREAEAAEYFKRAGEYARALYANAEALAHFQCALAFGHPAAGELHEALGDLQMLLGDYGAALTSYEKAAALSAPAALFSLEHKLGNVYQRRGQWEQAESHFRAALAALERNGQGMGADRERSKIYADWSLSAHQSDHADEALSLAHRAQELAEAAQDVRALAYSHNLLGILARSRDDLDLARDHLERSLEFAEALKEAGVRVAALNNLALVYEDRGDTEQALKLTETALAQCVAQGDRHREAALHNHLADLLHAAGQAEAAMAHLKQAVTIFAEIGAEAEATHWQPEIWKLTEW
jgi:predicted ATPase